MSDEINLPRDAAEMIYQMEEVCHGEGIGPDNEKLMLWIQKTYPDLREKFAYLYWPN